MLMDVSRGANGRAPIVGYAVAALAVGGAFIALALMQARWQAAAHVSLLLMAVIVTTRIAGAKAGVVATALAVLAFAYFLQHLNNPLADPTVHAIRLLALAAVSGYVVWITASERARADSLRLALDAVRLNNEALRAENFERKRTEEELRANEATFRTLAQDAPAAIFICQGGTVRYANATASAITGYSTSELCGQSFWDKAAPDSREVILAREAARQAGNPPPARFELKILTKAGEERWLDFTEAAFVFEGKPAELGIALDVSERKHAEEAVRKSERVLREAEGLGHTGSWEHDLIKGVIFNTPGNVRLFFGDDRNKGPRFEDFVNAVHPDDRAHGMAQHERLVSEGLPLDLEFRVVWPDGTVRMLLGRTAVVRDASGRIVRAYGTNVDVTERKQTEKAMRDSQELLNQVLATLPVGVAVMNRDGDFILGNAALKRIWGAVPMVRGEERWARSKGWWHDSGKRILPAEWASVRALSQEQTSLNELIDIENFTGEHKTIQNSAAPLRSAEGGVVGAVVVNEDVTERVQAQDALHDSADRLQHLSRRLLAVQEEERRHLSRELHDEFGQLLFSINLRLQAAKNAAHAEAQVNINESITLLQQAGTQVRSLALELRPMLLETAGLEATLRWLAQQYEQRSGVEIEVVGHVSEVSSEVAIACFRIVQEALTNVLRHSAARHVSIELGQSEGLLRLLIRDDGVGFEVSRTLEGAAAGSHLGLVGMRERVEILGGRLRIDSQQGDGTRIEVSFPVTDPATAPPQTA